MTIETEIPEGFERYDLGSGFIVTFGPVYRHRSEPRLGFRVAEHHVNPFGDCHGGALSTFADMQIVAIFDGSGGLTLQTPTISLSVDFLAPAPFHSWVESEVSLVKATRSLYFVQSLIRADGEPVGRANGIYRRLAPRD